IFRSILIANRGEIACRIIKTCRNLGIKTVAIYSDVDAREPHVSMADEAFHVGPAMLHESYLNVRNIMKAVNESQAEAVHPGYGFLSENMNFVKELENSNVTFIGPNSNAVKLMGDKLRSKQLAIEAGVDMIPGTDEEVRDIEHCLKVAKCIGYPVMIKASAGGGGKGMRIAFEEKDIRDGFHLAKKEAFSYFGDDRILIEKYIPDARHIEIQVLCDKFGNALYLNERDCSIQRRNQKIIEEAPSPFVDRSLRCQMGEQACALARTAGYDSAGTVEFLVDSNRHFYFLEMNTRLQVEHPITEEITGIDLVHQMIRIAYGHKLDMNQCDVSVNGCSVECRIYAENPYRNFGLPCSGLISKYIEPLDIPGIRCDSGVSEGSQVSISYDPMICKLIATGEDRMQALERMCRALDMFVIRGLTTNVPLLRTIISEMNFRRGHFSTNYLFKTFPDGFSPPALNKQDYKILATVAAYVYNQNEKRTFATQEA
uniref:Biotin carboxylase n=1 Tax=Romanomermis culicivorax TaxID=13658 RepID=A0A915JKW6_ROMCU